MVEETPEGTFDKAIHQIDMRIFERLDKKSEQNHTWLSFRHTDYAIIICV